PAPAAGRRVRPWPWRQALRALPRCAAVARFPRVSIRVLDGRWRDALRTVFERAPLVRLQGRRCRSRRSFLSLQGCGSEYALHQAFHARVVTIRQMDLRDLGDNDATAFALRSQQVAAGTPGQALLDDDQRGLL